MAPIAWAWPRRGTSRRYTTLKIVPFAFTAALAAHAGLVEDGTWLDEFVLD
jgi:hypothetical protein